MKKHLIIIALLIIFSNINYNASAQSQYWTDVQSVSINEQDRQIIPVKYRTLKLELIDLKKLLSKTVNEFSAAAKDSKIIIELPLPDGGMSRFYVYSSSIMEKPLADNFPQIQTFSCQGIDDLHASARIDYTEKGFHGMVLSANGCYFIDPYAKNNLDYYISYYKKDFTTKKVLLEEGVLRNPTIIAPPPLKKTSNNTQTNSGNSANRSNGTQLYTYRIAIAATGEYSAYQGGTVALALSAQVTSLNRVIAVYRKELAINLILVSNNANIIYLNASTDPYTNTNGSNMLGQNQTTLTSVIGSSNYDIGHVFSTGGGGIAMMGSVGVTSIKAQGVTGSSAPVGDPFDIDYVCHEMGHQFGANHSFNGSTGSCGGGNRNTSTAYEPGSGSTIMAYAGICSPQDLQLHSDPYFHTSNFDEIITNITTGSTGSSGCAVITSTGNTPPVASVGTTTFTIPKSTPFTLTGSATDSNGDTLSYYWEQFDLGSTSAPATPLTVGPRFRSYSPTTTPRRIIPNYADLLAGTTPIGEILPTAAQTAKFRFTARDNRSVGGGVNYDVNYCTVTFASVGPFSVNSPTIVAQNSNYTLTWNVNSTHLSPINCSLVKISLSLDGGLTFPTVLAPSTANDGTESLAIPNISSSNARFKIEAIGNIFFNISNVFIIGAVPAPTIISFVPTIGFPGDTILITGTGLAGVATVTFGAISATRFIINSNTSISAVVGAGATGSVQVTSASGTASLNGFTLGDSTIGIFKNIGTGTTTNTSTTYPAPYGNYFGGARHQMIYLASELTAQGLSAGLISQFGFNVATLIAGPLNGFTLKIGTTTSATLSALAATGLNTVFTTTAYSGTTGWNMHSFSTPFLWDGTSNIIIETCFNNNNTGTTGNTATYLTTGFTSGTCRYYNADNTATVCTGTTSTASTSRPNGRLFVTKKPTVGATNILFTNITNTSVTLTFTKGNGGKRIVVCRPTSATAMPPINLSNYISNAVFGLANTTGTNNYVVYNGSGNTLNVSGLNLLTSYTFTIYEYNGAAGNTIYQTIGTSGAVSTLPVTWQSFNANRISQAVLLNWVTANEINNNYFEVERLTGNMALATNNWQSIGTVKGNGNTNTTSKYSFTDKQLAAENSAYYRIKQVDFDGKTSFSKTVYIAAKQTENQSFLVKPNPSEGKFTVVYNTSNNAGFTISVYNLLGLEVWHQLSNNIETNIDLSNLPKGLYTVIINDADKTKSNILLLQ